MRPALAILIGLLFAFPAGADIFKPAYLELAELEEDRYAVLWKVPASTDGARLAVSVHFPATTEHLTPPQSTLREGAWTDRWEVRHADGLEGHSIRIQGNAVGYTDIIVRVERLNGSTQVERLNGAGATFTVQPTQGGASIAWSYTVLGIEHILGGIDHLLFVLALLLIVRKPRLIVATITAFTAAHSVTLAAATLGWMHVPSPPVEAIIALSIMFVAAEYVHGLNGKPGLTARAPWLVAFSFGLLHGFGFAGALSEVGLPEHAILLALLMFNVGVELGQLAFVATILLIGIAYTRWLSAPPGWLPWAAAYSIGAVSAFWTIERILSF